MAPSPPRLRILSGVYPFSLDQTFSLTPGLSFPPCEQYHRFMHSSRFLWNPSLRSKLLIHELGTEKILRSGRQCGLRLSLLATPSYERLRRDFSVEKWISSCGTVWDIIQVRQSPSGKAFPAAAI
jgi:hypothetical protein